jgi:hypothetical protein
MPKTVVPCSMPGCQVVAVSKVAAPWRHGPRAELRTYGYASATHIDPAVAYAQQRHSSPHLAPDESVSEIGTFPLLER